VVWVLLFVLKDNLFTLQNKDEGLYALVFLCLYLFAIYILIFNNYKALLKNEWVNKKKDFYDLSFPATAWNPEEIANNINYLKHIFVFKYFVILYLSC